MTFAIPSVSVLVGSSIVAEFPQTRALSIRIGFDILHQLSRRFVHVLRLLWQSESLTIASEKVVLSLAQIV
jgi:hypothetical protein